MNTTLVGLCVWHMENNFQEGRSIRIVCEIIRESRLPEIEWCMSFLNSSPEDERYVAFSQEKDVLLSYLAWAQEKGI